MPDLARVHLVVVGFGEGLPCDRWARMSSPDLMGARLAKPNDSEASLVRLGRGSPRQWLGELALT